MSSRRRASMIWVSAIFVGGSACARGGDVTFFETKIRPLLVDNCYTCHSANTNSRGGLRVDDRNGLIVGGESGAAVVPGQPDESLLIAAVRYEGPEMPPKKRLTDEQVADLEKWIADGAAWPDVSVEQVVSTGADEDHERLRKEHWAWQPLSDPAAPEVADGSWPRDDLDRFVLARLEAEGLRPVGDAGRRDLIRRVTFDLTGLPPDPEEIDAFLADESNDALEKVVDRLLASPAFGERWGRHWLDVARFGESTGPSRNIPFPHAWRYRDYVIDSINADKPFDQFIREQVAGDLMPAETPGRRDELKVATGFLALGGKDVNQRFKVRFVMDNVDEQIDTVSRSILGLTASCARCHDHKFDPIPTADYYALAGIFRSTELCAGVRNKMGGAGLDYYDTKMLIPLESDGGPVVEASAEEIERATKAFQVAKKEFEAIRGTPEGAALGPDGRPKQQSSRLRMVKLRGELEALTDPAVRGPVALGVRDAKDVADTEIRIRGEAEKLGPVVPRGFLSAVAVEGAPAVNPAQSGRLELARWLSSPNNPLTTRVFANRVWRHLIGRGIVASVDNFGVMGDRPSHPELLDHLAARFVRDGWSIKRLVRSVVLSRAYGLDSATTPEHLAADPTNRLVWRHAPRRLDAEEIRDATLAAAGQLDSTRPADSPARGFKVIEIRNDGPEARGLQEHMRASRARSVYLPLVRDLVPNSLQVFDFAEQGMVTGHRDTTTVPTQALYLLNDPFVRRRSLDLAERLLAETGPDDASRIEFAYELTLGRAPTANERERASTYLAEFEAEARYAIDWDAESGLVATAGAVSASNAGDAVRKPLPINDSERVVPDGAPLEEEVIRPSDPRAAAWASFCQALIGSAEFRYVR